MKLLRKLYFNPIVNRLNKNLSIRNKAYLAFLLAFIMILLFSVYVLYSYTHLKNREIAIVNTNHIVNNSYDLVLLLDNRTKDYETLQKLINKQVNEIDKAKNNLNEEDISLSFNLDKLENTLSRIKNYSNNNLKSNTSNDYNIVQSKQMDELAGELLFHIENIEKELGIISGDTNNLYRNKNILIYAFLLIGLLGSIIIANFISYRITDPIAILKDNIKVLEDGNYNLDNSFEVLDNDEIGDIARGINGIGETIKETVEFTEKIGRNDFDTDLEINKEGKLGKALISMRNNLNEITKQNEIQKEQEEKRNWVIKGLAELGNVLRSNFDDTNDFYFYILRSIINYIHANQGGFFIIKEDEQGKVLELCSSYAYDRRKFLSKEIEIGEGLIGQCAFEKQITNYTEIPNDYIQITSGLGGSNPRNLILIPLVVNEEIYGVIELASFEKFDEYQVDYLSQSSESIASSLESIQVNNQTKQLLDKTKVQAEEIASREEEMRQNMEELEATQEESQRKVEQLEKIIDDLRRENKVEPNA